LRTSFHSFSLWLIIVLTTIIVSFSFVRRNFNHRPTKSVRRKYGYRMVEFTWTLSPFLFVIVSLVPTIYIIAYVESVSRRIFYIVLRRQWFWTMSTFFREFFDNSYSRRKQSSADKHSHLILKVITSSEDVIHDYRVASQRLKIDAVPRRLNIGFRIRPSDIRVFYRNCQELCRVNHSYIPIINVFTN